jgi:hypothetical protein
MMSEAKGAGLTFKDLPDAEPDALLSTDSAKDKDGRLYDSRSGLGGYYRYSPRKISDLYDAMPDTLGPDGKSCRTPVPKIHEAVFGRIKTGAHFYAPIGFPATYEVVKSTDATVNYAVTGPTISDVTSTIVPNGTTVAEGAVATEQRHADQEEIWDIVWRKRAIYFLMVFVTGYLLLYPVLRDSYAFQELRTPLRMVSDTIRLIGSVLPGLASRWLDAYARDPGWFLVWASLVGFLIWISARLAGSINDRMRLLWTTYLPASNKPAEPRPPLVASYTQSVIFVAVIAYLLLYPYLSQLGWLSRLALPGIANELLLANLVQPVPAVLWAFLGIYFLHRKLVRKLRQWWVYQAVLYGFKYGIAPAASAFGLLYLAIALGSHYHFALRDSFGDFCTATPDVNANRTGLKYVAGKLQAEFVFDTSPEAVNRPNNLCISTGVFVETGARYRVVFKRLPEVETNPPSGKWTFFGEESYMGGQPVSRLDGFKSIAMTLLFPFRRSLDRPWGNIILRIGSMGNEEDFLDRAPPKQSDDLQAREIEYTIPDKSETLAEELKPKRDGELFVYLNKPVLGLWGYESWLSELIGNTGRAKIVIEKL